MLKPIQITHVFLMAVVVVVLSCSVLVNQTAAQRYNLADEVPTLPPIEESVASPSCDSSSACDFCSGCGSTCCACRDCCYCTTEKEKVKKHCWNVSCEKVCIPPVCVPGCCGCCWLPKWCCPCAKCRVRCISVLEKHNYECEECKCRWEVRSVPVNCGGCGCGDCCECAATTNPIGDSVVDLAGTSEMVQQPFTILSAGSLPTTVENRPVKLVSAEIISPDHSDASRSAPQTASKDRSLFSRLWSWARSENGAENK